MKHQIASLFAHPWMPPFSGKKLQRPGPPGKIVHELDGLRFLAIFIVVLQHLSERVVRTFPGDFVHTAAEDAMRFTLSRGASGVLLFFAISGFVLTLPFWQQADKKHGWTYGQYIMRRIRRLEPPYLLWMTVFFLVLAIKAGGAFLEYFPHYLASITYTHQLIFGGFTPINPVAWSLEIEIQFYLIAPFVALALRRITHNQTRWLVSAGLIWGYTALVDLFGWHQAPYKLTLLGTFPYFMIGILGADLWTSRKELFTGAKNHWYTLIGLASIPGMMFFWSEEPWKIFIFCFSIMGIGISAFRSPLFNAIWKYPWVAALGGMCYTIYLIHLPMLELITAVLKPLVVTDHFAVNYLIKALISLPIVWVASIVAFWWVERPFMNSKSDAKKAAQPVAPVAVKTLMLAGLLVAGAGLAQAQTLPSAARAEVLGGRQLLPRDSLISMALSASPEVRQARIETLTRETAVQSQKLSFTRFIVGGAGLDYGNGRILSLQNEQGDNPTNVFLDRRASTYQVGITARIPLYEILDRKNSLKIKQLAVQTARLDEILLEQTLLEEVSMRYERVQTALNVLDHEAASLEAQDLALLAAEEQFKQGKATVDAYAFALNLRHAAASNLEKAKGEARVAIALLEIIVGSPVFVP